MRILIKRRVVSILSLIERFNGGEEAESLGADDNEVRRRLMPAGDYTAA